MNTLRRPPLLARLRTTLAQRLPRMSGWALITALLMLALLFMAPHQLPVSLYKLSLVSLAAVAGYWIDRALFPYARPDALLAHATEPWLRLLGWAMLRRALIVAAAMLAIGLGA